MSVMLFRAARPPVEPLVCGSEGGVRRVLGVSYDWKTGTCFRETVFGMPTSVLNDMLRVPKVKQGLKRKKATVGPVRAYILEGHVRPWDSTATTFTQSSQSNLLLSQTCAIRLAFKHRPDRLRRCLGR